MKKVLIVRKMSALEFHYKFDNSSEELRKSHEQNGKSIARIEEILKERGIEYDAVTRETLSTTNYQDYDKVISAGGDGTVIAVAAYNKVTPQLNLKTDIKSEGCLCSEPLESAVNSTIDGNFSIDKWTRQDVYINGKLIGRALNETCVGEDMDFSKMAKYNLEITGPSGEKFKDYLKNSGLVIVTGTGSTGWGSAFKPYSRSDPNFKFTTILPNQGTLTSGELYSCKIVYKNHMGKVAIDTVKYELPRDSILEIKPSDFPLLVIKPNK